MAVDDRTLGKFELVGIPPAPRGVPQVEVSFDIDADGILHVSAKDLGTGKEQKIRITASGGLSEKEVEGMVKDAKEHEREDGKKRELIEVRNKADSLIYTTEKSLKEYGDKLTSSEKEEIEKEITGLKKVLHTSNRDEIENRVDALQKVAYTLSEKMYQQATAGQQETEAQQQEEPETETATTREETEKPGAVDEDY